jgi:hypothetical protein
VLFDEDAMATGIAVYTQVALAHLAGDPNVARVVEN